MPSKKRYRVLRAISYPVNGEQREVAPGDEAVYVDDVPAEAASSLIAMECIEEVDE